jgi:hypothetical protein
MVRVSKNIAHVVMGLKIGDMTDINVVFNL